MMREADIKALVRARDGMRCVRCGMTEATHYAKHRRALQVHRKEAAGRYTLANCETLCCACHGLERKGKPQAKVYLRSGRLQDLDILLVELPGGSRLATELRRRAKENKRTVEEETAALLAEALGLDGKQKK